MQVEQQQQREQEIDEEEVPALAARPPDRDEVTVKRTLIEAIYDRRKDVYPDVRVYRTPEAVNDRMNTLRAKMRASAPKKRSQCNRRYKKLLFEFQLLKYKLALYVAEEEDSPYAVTRVAVMRADETRSNNPRNVLRDARGRRAQTILLMHFIFRDYSNEKLRRLLARADQ
jgi:hypothetical protein